MMQVPKDSKMPLEWIQKACTQNPVMKLLDPTSGQFVGNYSTGPVRLAWTHGLRTPQKNDAGNDKYGCTVLFPPGVDLSILVAAVNECGAANFPENMTPQGFRWDNLQSPWHDQFEKHTKYSGYTPGAWFFNVGTNFLPRIVDTNMNDIVDDKRIYAGVWAILAVNVYPYGKVKRQGPTKKGVSFGLQSTVLIADDTPFGGAGLDPKAAFKGINIDSSVNPAAAFGQITPPSSPQPGGPVDVNAEMRRLGMIA